MSLAMLPTDEVKQPSIKTHQTQGFHRGRVHQAKRCQADKSKLDLTSTSAEVPEHMSEAYEEQAPGLG